MSEATRLTVSMDIEPHVLDDPETLAKLVDWVRTGVGEGLAGAVETLLPSGMQGLASVTLAEQARALLHVGPGETVEQLREWLGREEVDDE